MNIDASHLNKRLQIVRVTVELDADGYERRTETVIRSPWGQFSQTSGTEALKSGADLAEVKGRFLIRWTATQISRKDLVRYNGQDWEIEYINSYGDSREYVELICKLQTLGG